MAPFPFPIPFGWLHDAFDAQVNRQFREDIAIWESNIYQPSPQLCDGDGPVGKYRNWAKQFYLEAV